MHFPSWLRHNLAELVARVPRGEDSQLIAQLLVFRLQFLPLFLLLHAQHLQALLLIRPLLLDFTENIDLAKFSSRT